MNNENTIKALNKFLKGVHMGGTTFKDYYEKAQEEKLKECLSEILDDFKRNEEAITHRIEKLGGNAADNVGIGGMIGEAFEKLKLLLADTDEEILDRAKKAIHMGIEQGNKFIEEHNDLEVNVMNEIKSIVNDYPKYLIKLESINK